MGEGGMNGWMDGLKVVGRWIDGISKMDEWVHTLGR